MSEVSLYMLEHVMTSKHLQHRTDTPAISPSQITHSKGGVLRSSGNVVGCMAGQRGAGRGGNGGASAWCYLDDPVSAMFPNFLLITA